MSPPAVRPAKKNGRPTKKTPELVESMLTHIEGGGWLAGWCREHGIGRMTALEWVGRDPELSVRYAKACDARADAIGEDLMRIADTEPDAARARVQTDVRRWWLSRLHRRYADRQEVAHSGGVSIQVVTGVPDPVTNRAAETTS